jgi:hypothetical protein
MKQATLVMALVLVGCAIDGHDPDDPDGDLVGAVPTHEQDNCPSGGGGGGSGGGGEADPHPIPAPRDCTQYIDPVECRDCCDWNVENVWGERCRRIKDRRERALCWKDAEARRGECHRLCPLLTITVTP